MKLVHKGPEPWMRHRIIQITSGPQRGVKYIGTYIYSDQWDPRKQKRNRNEKQASVKKIDGYPKKCNKKPIVCSYR